MRRPHSARCAIVALAAVLASSGCGDDGETSASNPRADRVRAAAAEAGLPEEVGDVLAIAALGPTATFRVTYPGAEGVRIVVYQEPPDRRVDVLRGGQVVESRLLTGGVSYLCRRGAQATASTPLECRPDQSALPAAGSLSDDALDAFAKSLSGADGARPTVEKRTIAGETARCVIAPRREGAANSTGSTRDTLCVSRRGAELLVDLQGERVVASAYSTDVPKGTFDL